MLTRWDPFAEIARLQDQFARWAGSKEMPYAVPFAPAIDIYEDNDAIVVKAEVPGLRPDDVHISVEDNVLTLARRAEARDREREARRLSPPRALVRRLLTFVHAPQYRR